MKAKLILYDGTENSVQFKSFVGAKNLICMQGYKSPLEIIVLNEGKCLLIDEEGKLKNLPMNEKATAIAHKNEAIYPSDWICGDVILIDDSEEFSELPYRITESFKNKKKP